MKDEHNYMLSDAWSKMIWEAIPPKLILGEWIDRLAFSDKGDKLGWPVAHLLNIHRPFTIARSRSNRPLLSNNCKLDKAAHTRIHTFRFSGHTHIQQSPRRCYGVRAALKNAPRPHIPPQEENCIACSSLREESGSDYELILVLWLCSNIN